MEMSKIWGGSLLDDGRKARRNLIACVGVLLETFGQVASSVVFRAWSVDAEVNLSLAGRANLRV